jgi:hypothetical protein
MMRARRIALAVPALALALGSAAGCSQQAASDDRVATAATRNAGGNPSPTPSLSFEQRLRQWVDCMRDQGFDLPDPGRNAAGKISVEPPAGTQKGGPLEERYGAAQQKCLKLDPNEAEARPFNTVELEAQRQWAQCLRDQGLAVNDPDPNGMPARVRPGAHDTEEAMQKAMQACEDKNPFLKERNGR